MTPANVLLPADAHRELNDLGLARALVGTVLEAKVMEKKFQAELPYLSPEHVDPEAPVDDLSDQYCLGAVIYGLLTGRPPCEGATPDETIHRIKNVMPLRPKEVQKSLPDAFQAVLLQMMAKHPKSGSSSPNQIAEELETLAAAHKADG